MKIIQLTILSVVILFTGIFSFTNFSNFENEAVAQEISFSPYVDDKGNISFPHGFEKWPHLGSWMVHSDEEGGSAIHNVYTTEEVILEYRKTGKFPDGAPIVKDVRKASNSAHTTGNAYWANDVMVRFFMIKDTEGRFQDNPLWGDGWGWALFNGENTMDQVATDFRKDCVACHEPVRNNDMIYTYAYPTLGPKALMFLSSMESEVSENSENANIDMQNDDLNVLGEKVFARCKVCHSLDEGKNGLGPSLANLKDRKAGTVEGFNYSNAMKNSGVTWNEETLDSHLKDVRGFVKGNRMATLFPAGVKKNEERKAVINYLMSR